MSYQKDKTRRKWISLIKEYRHIELMNMLWRLKVITQLDRMFFIEKTHDALEQHERKKRKDNYYQDERPRWGKPTDIKPTKARR